MSGRMVSADEITWGFEPDSHRDVVLLAEIVDRLRPLSEQEKAQWILDQCRDKAALRLALQACMDSLSRELRRRGAIQ